MTLSCYLQLCGKIKTGFCTLIQQMIQFHAKWKVLIDDKKSTFCKEMTLNGLQLFKNGKMNITIGDIF